MLNADKAKNYVLASGEMHSVREFAEETLRVAGINFIKEGSERDEKYYAINGGHKTLILQINPEFYRPAEVHKLLGDQRLQRQS